MLMVSSTIPAMALPEPGFAAPRRSTAAPAEDPGPQAPADQVDAMRQAHLSKQRVEVASQRTETSQTFAEPDGTLTMESTARPARVHRSDGSWTEVDTTLSRDLNGAVVPAAASAGLEFSGGGSGAMATVSKDNKSLSLTWPNPLPTPTLAGSVATYADVLPGVDLQLTAEVDGFGEILVVKTRDAADNPELTTLRMGVSGDGVTVSVDATGQLSAVDSNGTTVFGAPTPLMWDSSGSTSTSTAPDPAARQAIVSMSMDGSDGLALVPDPTMLTDPATVYPVYVDPDVSTSIYSWTYVDSQFPSQAYMSDKGRTDAPAGMYQATNGGYYTQRSYVRFEFSQHLANTQVTKAELRAYSHYQWNAVPTDHPVHAYSTSAPDTSTTWNNQPSIYHDLGEHQVHAGEWVGFDAKAAVQQAADNDWLHLAFRISSGDESNYQARETYSMSGSTQPVLAVTIDHQPNVPTGLKISPCYKACASPAITSSLQAALTATVSDPDGGNLKNVKIEVWSDDYTTKVAWTYASLTNIKSGSNVSWVQVGPRANGKTYHWKVSACDSAAWCSDWSAWFTFATDTTNPTLPTVSSTEYPALGAGQEVWSGGVGVAGTFEFGPNGTMDVAEYHWSLDRSPPGTAVNATNGNASITITPATDGVHRLFVQSVNSAGTASEITEYEFGVKAAPGNAGYWPLDEGQGTTAEDMSTADHPATLYGGATWMPGHVGDGAVELNGTDQYLATDVATLDTTGGPGPVGFSVSAWVYLEDNSRYHTVLSEDGSVSSAFYLQYRSDPDCDCWAFGMRDADTADGVTTVALSQDKAWVGEWTHLVGIYDAVNHQLRMYVNGVLQPSQPSFTTPIAATSPLNIGRGLHGGQIGWYWQGQVDEVGVYQRLLTSAEVYQMAHAADPV